MFYGKRFMSVFASKRGLVWGNLIFKTFLLRQIKETNPKLRFIALNKYSILERFIFAFFLLPSITLEFLLLKNVLQIQQKYTAVYQGNTRAAISN